MKLCVWAFNLSQTEANGPSLIHSIRCGTLGHMFAMHKWLGEALVISLSFWNKMEICRCESIGALLLPLSRQSLDNGLDLLWHLHCFSERKLNQQWPRSSILGFSKFLYIVVTNSSLAVTLSLIWKFFPRSAPSILRIGDTFDLITVDMWLISVCG